MPISVENRHLLSALFSLAFIMSGLSFVNYVIYFDWLEYFVCANKPSCGAQVVDRNKRPDTLRIPDSFKIAEMQGSGLNSKLVIRDSMPHEQYVVSQRRWDQMSTSLKKTVESEWIKFSENNNAASAIDVVHTFYEFVLNEILIKIDTQLSSAESVFNSANADVDYCGTIFTKKNTIFYHSDECTCKPGELRVNIGEKLYLCASPNKQISFVQTQLSQNVNLSAPTEDLYNAPFPRSITRIRYNQNQKFALTPDLDALVPIN